MEPHVALIVLYLVTAVDMAPFAGKLPKTSSFQPLSSDDAASVFRKMFSSGGALLQPNVKKMPLAPNATSTQQKQSTKHVKVPQYMMDLFEMVTNSNGLKTKPDVPIEGNLVRSFFNEAMPPRDESARPTSIKYYFNIADIGKRESVKKAELRLFKLKHHKKAWRHAQHFYRMQIMSLYDDSILYEGLSSETDFGWKTFSLTNLVQQWVAFPTTNKGVQVLLTGVGRSSVHVRFATDEHDQKEPILVVFSDDNRSKRPLQHVNNNTNVDTDARANNLEGRRRMRNPSGQECKREEMKVEFDKIAWDSWVVFPKSFDAYQCKGRCGIHNGERTNHALLQAMLSETGVGDDQGVSAPCCVPKKLQPLTMLLYERFQSGQVVKLQAVEDMVVENCGCA